MCVCVCVCVRVRVCVCTLRISPGSTGIDFSKELIGAAENMGVMLETLRVTTAQVYFQLAEWAHKVLASMCPAWEEAVQRERIDDIKKILIDSSVVKNAIKPVHGKAKSILKAFRTCDEKTELSKLVTAFPNCLKDLDKIMDHAQQTVAMQLGRRANYKVVDLLSFLAIVSFEIDSTMQRCS